MPARLAATITGLEFLLSQLSYDHAHPRILARAQALAGRMQLFLPLMSSLADPLIALMRDLHIRPAELDELLADAATWFDAPLPAVRAGTDGDMTDDPVAQRLRERIAALQPADDARELGRALLSNALWRLRGSSTSGGTAARCALIGNEAGVWQPRYRHWRLGGTERFFDRGMMLFSTLTVVAAIVFASWLWIASGWHDGAAAVTLVAVSCSFFAALDGPRRWCSSSSSRRPRASCSRACTCSSCCRTFSRCSS